MQPHERIYVAVDTTDLAKALVLVRTLKGRVGGFKIGLELITSLLGQILTRSGIAGLVRELFTLIGPDLFWDGKFSDIPNTVEGATQALQSINPRFFNVHANCGVTAMKKAVAARGASKVLAVTLLTSFDQQASMDTFGGNRDALVLRWAQQAQEAGVDGLVCSPDDLKIINTLPYLRDLPKMTPGIRPAGSKQDDQKRIATPSGAIAAGSTWLVIGRPITEHPDGPVAGVEAITDEISQA